MPKKLQTAKTLLNIYGGILLVFGIVFGFGFLIAGIFFRGAGSSDATLFSALFGSAVGIFFLIFMGGIGAFHLFTAKALENRKPWAKVAATILGILMLGSFPLGTIFGVFILVGIFDTSSESWFESTAVVTEEHAKKS